VTASSARPWKRCRRPWCRPIPSVDPAFEEITQDSRAVAVDRDYRFPQGEPTDPEQMPHNRMQADLSVASSAIGTVVTISVPLER
jgi:hypothetical protein